MHPTEIFRPIHHAGWIYEEKVDGWRVLAYKDAAGVRLVSQNARDLTRRFPDLVTAVAELEVQGLILDGEIAIFDSRLVSRFEWLRGRPKDETATPPILIAFDCLHAHGRDLRERPLRVRRNVLEALLEGQNLVLPARRLAENGLDAWDEVLERGYEGMVAKDPESRYVPGRTLKWLKVKQKDYRKEARGFYRE
jgi:bifunctional non-homologous end joining protein LigD